MSGPRARVYLDHNATSPLRPQAREAWLEALACGGNPSSVHAEGRAARRRLEDARERIARRLNVAAERIVFTSGGTEADNLALHQVEGPILVSAIEHPAVLEPRPDALRIPVTSEGLVDLAALAEMLQQHRPQLVAVMLANNETGAIQPIVEVARLVHAAGALLHVDAVQAAGRMELEPDALGADLLALSAHKLGGPVGIGALVVGDGLELRPLIRGGGQERRRRSGTENVAGACGMAAALDAALADDLQQLRQLRDAMEVELQRAIPEVRIFAQNVPRLANTSCIALPGVDATTQLVRLDLEGIAVSAGSACSSGKIGPSHVLTAMGVPPQLARCAIRVSLGWSTTAADIERFIRAWTAMARALLPRPALASTAVCTT